MMGNRVAPPPNEPEFLVNFLQQEEAARNRPAMRHEPPLPLDPDLTVFGNAPPPGRIYKDPRAFFQASIEGYLFRVVQMLERYPMINVQFRMSATLEKDEDRATFWLQPPGLTVFQRSDSEREISRKLLKAFETVMEDLARFTEEGSGFRVESVDKAYIYVTPYEPLTAGWRFPLPKKLTSRKAVIDVYKGPADDCCLKWALRACLFQVDKNPERKAKYPGNGQDGLDYTGLDFPTPWTQIGRLEKNNPHIAVNLFLYNNKEDNISTMRQSSRHGDNIKVVNLLLVTDDETDKHHYVWIKNMSRLLRRQANNNNQVFVCGNCLSVFKTKEKQETHVPDCLRNSQNGARPIRLEFPTAGTPQATLQFERHERKRKVPWVVYMDFECLLPKPNDGAINRGNHSVMEASHEVCGASFLAVCPSDTLPLFLHRGPDSADKLLHALVDAGKEMRRQMKATAARQQQNMTFADWRRYNSDMDCSLCDGELHHYKERDQVEYFSWTTGHLLGKVHRYTKAPNSRKSCFQEMRNKEWEDLNEAPDGKVDFRSLPPRAKPTRKGYEPPENEDDCINCHEPLLQTCFREAHLSFDELGHFAGAVHARCRCKPAHLQEIPVFIHNARGYDSHLLMQAISQVEMPGVQHKLTCIPNNREKLLTFTWNGFGFKDSLQHMASPLDALVKSALGPPDDPCANLAFLRKMFGGPVPLLARKGVYPYERMQAWEDFDLECLPPIEDFYSSLKLEGVKEADYAHAQRVWKEFGCKNMGDYHDLYLKSDVALLADVYEAHRELCHKTYGLDPAHYITSPGLSWDALLKHTGVKLELLTDVDKYLFIEKGMRGGISRVSQRQTTANVPGTVEYDNSKPAKHILYVDANNLYGWAMCQPLPVSGFRGKRLST